MLACFLGWKVRDCVGRSCSIEQRRRDGRDGRKGDGSYAPCLEPAGRFGKLAESWCADRDANVLFTCLAMAFCVFSHACTNTDVLHCLDFLARRNTRHAFLVDWPVVVATKDRGTPVLYIIEARSTTRYAEKCLWIGWVSIAHHYLCVAFSVLVSAPRLACSTPRFGGGRHRAVQSAKRKP